MPPVKKPKAVLEDTPIKVVEIEGVKEIESENTVAEGSREKKARYPGNWIKATQKEVEQYTREGRLFGYDPETQEVLIDVNKK